MACFQHEEDFANHQSRYPLRGLSLVLRRSEVYKIKFLPVSIKKSLALKIFMPLYCFILSKCLSPETIKSASEINSLHETDPSFPFLLPQTAQQQPYPLNHTFSCRDRLQLFVQCLNLPELYA